MKVEEFAEALKEALKLREALGQDIPLESDKVYRFSIDFIVNDEKTMTFAQPYLMPAYI